MIYYYFGDKDGLYREALETEYARVRGAESKLDLAGLDPVTALKRLAEFIFDFHAENSNFVRLIMIENIHRAEYLKESVRTKPLNQAVIDKISDICRRGQQAGLFRDALDPVELHWAMTAFSFYNLSNRLTFSVNFGDIMLSETGQESLRQMLVRMVLSVALTPAALLNEIR